MGAIWMVVIALGFGFLLSKSLFGFRLKAIGGNPVAAQFARIPVRRYKFWAFVICSLSGRLAGMLDFSFIGSSQPNSGTGLLFPTFAAVIIGGASLTRRPWHRRRHARWAALLLAILNNGLALMAAGAFAAADVHRHRHDRRRGARPATRNWRRDR